MTSLVDQAYWTKYTPIQQAKHNLLQRYLDAWFPILASFNGLVLYVDCHAGRGRHTGGQVGSPLVALTTLLGHNFKDKILARCQVQFIFLEENPAHAKNLQEEINQIEPLPSGITYTVLNNDFEAVLQDALDRLSRQRRSLAPSFFFFDPYNFNLPMRLLQRILSNERSELLITFMDRWINLAIRGNPRQEERVDKLFGTSQWQKLRGITDTAERHRAMIQLYIECLGCSYSSVLEMRGKRREPKYSLIHATNHRRGREKMKEALWSLTDGLFKIYQGNDPRQLPLFKPQPDLTPLRAQLLTTFEGCDIHYEQLKDWLLDLPWLDKHLKQVLNDLAKAGHIEVAGGTDKFVATRNQLLRFRQEQA